MNVGETFRSIYMRLKVSGVDSPHLESGWIIEKYVDITSAQRIQHPESEINKTQTEQIEAAVSRREKGEPLAYILGEKEFYSFLFYVDKNVLIPRPETEFLVEWAITWAKKNKSNEPIEVLDLGTGSGCVGISILRELPTANLSAVDISKAALEVAKKNAEAHGVIDRVEFIELDCHRAGHLLKKYDLIVANPPYISPSDGGLAADVKKFEPHIALFSGDEGYRDIVGWLKAVPNILKPQAAVGFEIGASQGNKVTALFRDLGIFSKHYIIKDYAEHDRIVCGER
jgi:release factor glutamine methyltransferase